MTYRVGRHLGRTIYRGDELIGIMDTPELGSLVVEALNTRERVLQAGHQVEGRAQVPSGPVTCGRVGMHNCGITGRWESHDSGYPQVGGHIEEVPGKDQLAEVNPLHHGIINTAEESIGEHAARCSGCT